jgi:hypothetical protein
VEGHHEHDDVFVNVNAELFVKSFDLIGLPHLFRRGTKLFEQTSCLHFIKLACDWGFGLQFGRVREPFIDCRVYVPKVVGNLTTWIREGT